MQRTSALMNLTTVMLTNSFCFVRFLSLSERLRKFGTLNAPMYSMRRVRRDSAFTRNSRSVGRSILDVISNPKNESERSVSEMSFGDSSQRPVNLFAMDVIES